MAWWKRKDRRGQEKKGRKGSPEHGGKDPKKQNIENKEGKIVAGMDSLMKMLENRWNEEQEKQKERDAVEKERWDSLNQKIEKENKDIIMKIDKIESRMNKELDRMKQEIEGIKAGKQEEKERAQKSECKLEELEEKLEFLKKELTKKFESGKSETEGMERKELKKNEIESHGKEKEKTSKELKWIIEEVERERRRKNVIISGLDTQDKESLIKWFALRLGAAVGIRKIWNVRNVKKTIGVQLENLDQKAEVMKNKSKLKQEKDMIFINSDSTWIERQNRKEVIKKAKELNEKGIESKIAYNKIITEKEVYFWNERVEKWFRKEKPKSEK